MCDFVLRLVEFFIKFLWLVNFNSEESIEIIFKEGLHAVCIAMNKFSIRAFLYPLNELKQKIYGWKKEFRMSHKKKRWKNYEEHEHIKKQSRQCATITKESVERASERYKIGIDVACANIYIHEPFKMWLIWKLRFAALVWSLLWCCRFGILALMSNFKGIFMDFCVKILI